jgi:hypothetical protein
MNRAARRRAQKLGIVGQHGIFDFEPDDTTRRLVESGLFYAIWRKGQTGPHFVSIEELPAGMADPRMVFLYADAEAIRRAHAALRKVGK